MLHLHSTSPLRWLDQVAGSLPEILIDHAHCEQKAAATAMDLMFDYVGHEEICDSMSEIVREELEHFGLVRELLKRRGIRFRGQKPGSYGRLLNGHVRRQEPFRAVDRLLVAALIEARSCERFQLLSEHLPDAELRLFYGSLFESEARHHAVYVRLAGLFAETAEVQRRLAELADEEAQIIASGCELPRIHS
jgi:tRNA-(ms[2]io[6]A)-hydroxylase